MPSYFSTLSPFKGLFQLLNRNYRDSTSLYDQTSQIQYSFEMVKKKNIYIITSYLYQSYCSCGTSAVEQWLQTFDSFYTGWAQLQFYPALEVYWPKALHKNHYSFVDKSNENTLSMKNMLLVSVTVRVYLASIQLK